MNSGSDKGRRWKDKNHYERHYCEVCNAWMAADRASILTHQNGKKHAEKYQEAQAKKSLELAAQEKQKLALQKTLQQMESAAAASMQQAFGLFGATPAINSNIYPAAMSYPAPILSQGAIPPLVTSIPSAPLPVGPATVPPAPVPPPSNKLEKKEWDDRKKQRDLEKKQKRGQESTASDEEGASRKRHKIKISDKDGHYPSSDGLQIWLEGTVFGGILEEELPIQVWIGNSSASNSELQLSENQRHWKDGLVVAVRQRPSADAWEDRMVVDVAYLPDGGNNDDKEQGSEEQLLKSVSLKHIRILLGGDGEDGRIPSSLDEARLLAMGGEEVVVKNVEDNTAMDEATGLSGWSTVKIKRTTVRNELKEERDAARQKRKAAALQAEKDAKQAEARRMEEAKVSNANDSALGAYDVWNRSKDGYKGVNIHADPSLAGPSSDEQDIGKKLATDGNVAFKKNFKASTSKKKRNIRTTSADDD